MKKLKLTALMSGLLLLAAACGGDSTPEAPTEVASEATAAGIEGTVDADTRESRGIVIGPTGEILTEPPPTPTEVPPTPTPIPPTDEPTVVPPTSTPVEPTEVAEARIDEDAAETADEGDERDAQELVIEVDQTAGSIFRAETAIDALVANGDSETTLLAFLSTADGVALDNERVRFVLQDGMAYLDNLDESTISKAISVDARNIGNGIYVARVRASDVAGTVTLASKWLSAPDFELPVTTTSIRLITAEHLEVRVDDNAVVADGVDTATIVAYVLDGLNKPMENARVIFRIVDGPGSITPLNTNNGEHGRYAALYRAGMSPGVARIEVSLPAITNPIGASLRIQVVDASTVEAVAFPRQVARRLDPDMLDPRSVGTILAAVRDGDGDLVKGLQATDLQASVVSGPGEISGPVELELENGEPAGVYQFAFIATEIADASVVEIVNLASPNQARTQVRINTAAQISPGVAEDLEVYAFGDRPLYGDGENRALLVAFAGDDDGNPIRASADLPPAFLVTGGRGQVTSVGAELDNIVAGAEGTGVYTATFTTGAVGVTGTADVRMIFSSEHSAVVTETITIDVSALAPPEVVIFPNPIPAGHVGPVYVDVYDVNDRPVTVQQGLRYRVEIEDGPGEIMRLPNNLGIFADIRADDNIASGIFEMGSFAGGNQNVHLVVVDEGVPGFPTGNAVLQVGQQTQLAVVVSPPSADPGDKLQVVAFARNEFGIPATDHELVLTVEYGSALVLERGRMIDDGNSIDDFLDAYPSDGVYTGGIRVTGTAQDSVTVRVTDLTSPNQPTALVQIPVSSP